MSEKLDHAANWQDVVTAFADHGLVLEEKGSGLVAGTRESYTTLSALNLAWSAKEFEKRFNKPFAAFAQRPNQARPHWFDVDDIDIVRALVLFGLAEQADISRAIDGKRRLEEQGMQGSFWPMSLTCSNTCLTTFAASSAPPRQTWNSRLGMTGR